MQRYTPFLFVLLFFYLFVLQVQAIWPFTIDDMYITLRYARHWHEGLGLVWNAGEGAVEGYSNFLFVVLGRLLLSLGLDPVTGLKGAGVVGLALVCAAVYGLSRFWFTQRLALLPCVWLLTYKGQIIWSVSGLETTVYQALLCFAVYFIFKGLGYKTIPLSRSQTRGSYVAVAGILLSLAGMTRPEAPVFMLIFCVWIGLDSGISRVQKQQMVCIFTGTLLLCFAPYFLWRWFYFGNVFPNPVYCKGVAPGMNGVLVEQYWFFIWPVLLLALPALLTSRDWRLVLLWFPSVIYGVMLWRSEPLVAFDNRLFLPAIVLFLPLALQGMRVLVNAYFHRVEYPVMYAGALLFAWFCIPHFSLENYRQFTQNPRAGELLRGQVIEWLKLHTQPDSRIVLADSGLIPYRSERAFIDSYCLNHVVMAHYPSNTRNQQCCEQVLQDKPDVIILTSLVEQGNVQYTPVDACLAPELTTEKSGYLLHAVLQSGNKRSTYRYEIFKKAQ